MRVLPIIIVGLVFASAAFLVQPVHAQPASTVSGEVCMSSPWAADGCDQPIPGATVRLTGGPLGVPLADVTTQTDKIGRFTFSNVVQGDYKVAVSRAGFDPAQQTLSAPAADLTFILTAQSIAVEGTITDSTGAKVAGARVSFWGSDYASARTAADGKFLAKLRAGAYTMEVDAGKSGYVQQQVFVDGSRLDVALVGLSGHDAVVTGRIADQHGAPVSGADVIVDQWERKTGDGYQYGNFRNWTTTNAAGEYRIDVYAGGLSLRFSKAGYAEVYEWTEVAAGKPLTIDAKLAKYPEKTARLAGSVTDASGNPLSHVSISIQHPEYGLYSCSIDNRYGSEQAKPMSSPAMESYPAEPDGDDYDDPYYRDPGCDITVHADGTFTGNVTPGYAILSIWYDQYAACDDGARAIDDAPACGAGYFGYSQTLNLQAEATNTLNVQLRARLGPDATVSGYAVDTTTEQAVANAYISFNNEETYAWGSAQTDQDGSYKIRVRSGYHQVHVWADGFLPWQGVVYIAKGSDMPFDVVLTPGEARYGGGCCYSYQDGETRSVEAASMGPSGESPPVMEKSVGVQSGGSDSQYEDLRGGLGPYDASQRAMQLQSGSGKQSPVPVAFALIGLGLVALRRRF